MGVTVSLYQDKRVSKKDKFYPIKLRVTHNRQRTYLSISASRINKLLTGRLEDYRYIGRESYSIEKSTFEKITQQTPRRIYKELQVIFRRFELDYQQMADSLIPFTIEKFKEQFSEKQGKTKDDVLIQLGCKIELLKSENRFNSAMSYSSTLRALKDYHKRKDLSFDAVTPKYLGKFKNWMLKNNKSETTTGIYLRSLRSVFNEAISNGVTSNYPFHNSHNKSGFKIQSGSGRKIALSTNELKAIFEHKYQNKYPGQFYVDSWKLLYLLQGINPTDLCLLKFSNIDGNLIVFTRAKTQNSKPIEIRIPINEQIEVLFEKWGNPETSKNVFIWPVLTNNNKEDQFRQTRQFFKLVNRYVKLLATELQIEKNITTYVTRHSYATQLMRHGAPVAFISKQLGHTSTGTTDVYLGSFENDQLKEWQEKSTDFSNGSLS